MFIRYFFLVLFPSLSFQNLRISTQNSNPDSNFLSIHIPVKGNSTNLHYYYIDLVIGSSMQRQSFLLDTSTSLTASPCSPFTNSTGQHKNNFYYAEEASIVKCKNEQDESCKFKKENLEGDTIEGIYTKQAIRFDKEDDKPSVIPIGCSVREEGVFYNQKVDGILGLANKEDSIIDKLYKEGKINKKSFSLCLNQNGGYFTLGNIYQRLSH